MAATNKTTKAKEAFVEYLQACNMRITSERLSVVEVISKHSGLFTIDELHSLMIREAFPVSTATLYNTIDLLMDAGLVKCLRLPERSNALYRMDLSETPHVYLVCQQCGAIKESSAKTLTRMIGNYDFQAFDSRSFVLTVFGLCKNCKKK